MNNLLNYYDQRGTLLRVPFLNNLNADQLELINREIVSHIKNSEWFVCKAQFALFFIYFSAFLIDNLIHSIDKF